MKVVLGKGGGRESMTGGVNWGSPGHGIT